MEKREKFRLKNLLVKAQSLVLSVKEQLELKELHAKHMEDLKTK